MQHLLLAPTLMFIGPDVSVSLEMILHFFSGSGTVPPCGFPPGKPVLQFNNEDVYLTASTCALELTIPTRYEDYSMFKERLNQAFTMHGGFGKIISIDLDATCITELTV